MAYDIFGFKIGEIIKGAWMEIQIVETRSEDGLIIAVILGLWPIAKGFCGKRLKFFPQERIALSWICSDLPSYPLVLCLRTDGIKVLG